MKHVLMLKGLLLVMVMLMGQQSAAAEYQIDTRGAHASIIFKIPHLGYSTLVGRFDQFSGYFSYDDANPNESAVSVVVDTKSLNSNHAERDKHLRSKDFLDVEQYPRATFTSTRVIATGEDTLEIEGELTLHGVTNPITIEAIKIGEGKDPWGGYRAGFSGSTVLRLKDFGIAERLGPASTEVTMELHVEGIRQ